jgi:hypothetical protein
MIKIFFYKMWFKPIFFRLFGSFYERTRRARLRASRQLGGFPSPPAAAKNVRTIFNIVHTLELVNVSASPLRGSAAKLNGIFQLIFLSLFAGK